MEKYKIYAIISFKNLISKGKIYMAIITKNVKGKKYLVEITYIEYKNGKRKYKSKSLGRINENGELIPSRKNWELAIKKAPAELVLKVVEKRYIIRPKNKNEMPKEKTKELIKNSNEAQYQFDKASFYADF